MSKILITGGLGFIGGALAEKLAVDDYDICCLAPKAAAMRTTAMPCMEYMAGSISDDATLKVAFEGAVACVHLAGSSVIENPRLNAETSPEPFLEAASRLFAAAAHRNVPVIYASSATVYGQVGAELIKESDLAAPINAHGEEKLIFETLAHQFNISHGLPTVGLRMFNIYGANQSPASPYCGVLRLAVQAVADREPVTIHGDGSHLRDFVHVDDVVRFIRMLLARPLSGAERVNVCTGRGLSVNDVVSMVAVASGCNIEKTFVDTVSDGVASSVGDPGFARDRYGFEAAISAEMGIADTVSAVFGAPGRARGRA